MELKQRETAVRTRLNAALEEATRRLALEKCAEDRIDNVQLRAFARDVQTACSQTLATLVATEESISCAEQMAKASEDTLALTPETVRQTLRALADQPPMF